ncbi:MAG: hypothetical protein GY856_44860 [bacterium]|nr:hypothetical protein [bacterium]
MPLKVFMPHMIQDPSTARYKGIRPADGFHCTLEKNYRYGPVSDRIAVLDFDHETGKLHRRVGYKGRPKGLKMALYNVARNPTRRQIRSRKFNCVSVFATILRTMKLFQDPYRIGRELTWKNGPQLLVIPRAGEWANAFYDRETNSINFYFLRSQRHPRRIIYTSLSRDIVVHEATHAIVDGIAPDLLDAATPESLAIHEAIADFTAMLVAFESKDLVEKVLTETRGGIEDSTAFCAIAPEFAEAREPEGKAMALRDLLNSKRMDELEEKDRAEPHKLSEILSGALYSVLMLVHAEHRHVYSKQIRPKDKDKTDYWYSCSGKALKSAGFRVGNTALRALDYLPPGEVSFADYGRAMLAVDEAGQLNPPHVRQWLREEFLLRQMVSEPKELEVETNFRWQALDDLDIERLIEDDEMARRFAEQSRTFLRIPSGVDVEVLPRLRTRKVYYDAERHQDEVEECLFKVSWIEEEPDRTLSIKRKVKRGTTLSVNLSQKRIKPEEGPLERKVFVRLLLTSDRSEVQREQRDRMIGRLLEDGLLRLDEEALDPDGEPLGMVVTGDTSSGALELRGAGRLLHLVE